MRAGSDGRVGAASTRIRNLLHVELKHDHGLARDSAGRTAGRGLIFLFTGGGAGRADRLGGHQDWRSAVHGDAGAGGMHGAGLLASATALAVGATDRSLHSDRGMAGLLLPDAETG